LRGGDSTLQDRFVPEMRGRRRRIDCSREGANLAIKSTHRVNQDSEQRKGPIGRSGLFTENCVVVQAVFFRSMPERVPPFGAETGVLSGFAFETSGFFAVLSFLTGVMS
jgi:hypothetical protein